MNFETVHMGEDLNFFSQDLNTHPLCLWFLFFYMPYSVVMLVSSWYDY